MVRDDDHALRIPHLYAGNSTHSMTTPAPEAAACRPCHAAPSRPACPASTQSPQTDVLCQAASTRMLWMWVRRVASLDTDVLRWAVPTLNQSFACGAALHACKQSAAEPAPARSRRTPSGRCRRSPARTRRASAACRRSSRCSRLAPPAPGPRASPRSSPSSSSGSSPVIKPIFPQENSVF